MARKIDWFNPYNPMSNRKVKNPSHTNGKDKGGTCVTTPELRSICRRNRSYKRDDYGLLAVRIEKAKR